MRIFNRAKGRERGFRPAITPATRTVAIHLKTAQQIDRNNIPHIVNRQDKMEEDEEEEEGENWAPVRRYERTRSTDKQVKRNKCERQRSDKNAKIPMMINQQQ